MWELCGSRWGAQATLVKVRKWLALRSQRRCRRRRPAGGAMACLIVRRCRPSRGGVDTFTDDPAPNASLPSSAVQVVLVVGLVSVGLDGAADRVCAGSG